MRGKKAYEFRSIIIFSNACPCTKQKFDWPDSVMVLIFIVAGRNKHTERRWRGGGGGGGGEESFNGKRIWTG